MARYDIRTPRLYVEEALAPARPVALSSPQAHYLRDVLRLKPGDSVLTFNGRDGEWRATLAPAGKRGAALMPEEKLRDQPAPADVNFMFAPLKHSRLDYLVQKAVEMGVSRLQPVITRHTQVTRVNIDRMRANTIEAAEQCGILFLPEVSTPAPLEWAVAEREPARLLIFCDEDADASDPIAALASTRNDARQIAVLVGPEGGFAQEERALLLRQPNVLRLTLGPRILRGDTAAVASLALVQAVLGDWR